MSLIPQNLLPRPLDVCEFAQPFIKSYLDDNYPNPGFIRDFVEELITNTCNGLANNEVTLNEVFNLAHALINNIDTQSLASFANTTFVDYTKQWLPYQYGTLIGIILVIIIYFSLSDYLEFRVAILLAIGITAFLLTIAVLQVNEINDFLTERESTFQTLISGVLNAAFGAGALNYAAASQLTIDNNVNDRLITLRVPNPPPDKIPKISPPYQKLIILNTITPENYSPTPALFPIILIGLKNSFYRYQNAVRLYVMNANPYNKGELGLVVPRNPVVPNDIGIINIMNAYTGFPADNQNKEGIGSSLTRGPGVFINPGEVKCFINVGVNSIQDFAITKFIAATDVWVEVTSDVRPFVQKLTFNSSGNLLPTHRIHNIYGPANITVTLDKSYAYDGQEVIIVANITDNPPTGVIDISSTSITPQDPTFPIALSNLQKLTLQFHLQNDQGFGNWIVIDGPV